MEFIEPELKKMEEDPNNPIFSMLKELMPQQGQGEPIHQQNNQQNLEDQPQECKNN